MNPATNGLLCQGLRTSGVCRRSIPATALQDLAFLGSRQRQLSHGLCHDTQPLASMLVPRGASEVVLVLLPYGPCSALPQALHFERVRVCKITWRSS